MNRIPVSDKSAAAKRILRGFSAVAVSLSAFLFISCGGQFLKDQSAADLLIQKGKFKDAARLLLSHANKSGKEQLLAQMECGLLLNAAQDYQKSSDVLMIAGNLAKTIPVSISQQAASLFLNESTTNYRGEDFERVLIHMYAGMDFLLLSKEDEARVEFKQVNDTLQSYRDAGYKTFKQNIMAKYLTAIAFELTSDETKDMEDLEFAYIEMKQVYQLDPANPFVKRDLLRLARKLKYNDDAAEWKGKFGEIAPLSKDAEIDLVYQAGMSAIKASRGKLMSDKEMATSIRIAIESARVSWEAGVTVGAVLLLLNSVENPIPFYKKRANKIEYASLVIDGKESARTYVLEDITDTSTKSLEEKYGYLRKKVAAGIVVKAVAAVVSGLVAKKIAEQSKKTGGVAGLIGLAVGAGVGVGLTSQIQPDLRCWHSLPDTLQIAFAGVAAGKHKISLNFYAGGTVIEQADLGEVEVASGQRVVLNHRTIY